MWAYYDDKDCISASFTYTVDKNDRRCIVTVNKRVG